MNRTDQVFNGTLIQIYLLAYPSELTRVDKKHVQIGRKFTLRQVCWLMFRRKCNCMERSGAGFLFEAQGLKWAFCL